MIEHRSRHEAAIANTLAHADESAANGDYADALSWLQTVRAIGERLPEDYERKRREWVQARGAGDV